MSNNWQQSCLAIKDFISNHPEIKIDTSVIRITERLRPEFNHLLIQAREAFIKGFQKERNKALLDEGENLSKEYLQIEDEIIKQVGLERILPFVRVDHFLHNPKDALIGVLRDPLMDFLKGKCDFNKYEEEASNILDSSYKSFFQRGYEIWLVLSLIKLLEADKSFRVDTDEFDNDEYFAHGPGGGARLPEVKELKEFSFRHNDVIGLLVADQIIHSSKNGYYYSFRPHIVHPVGDVESFSENREWLQLSKDTLENIERNVILIYLDKELEPLSLIADSIKICRPDLIIECIGLEKMFDENSMDKIKHYHSFLKPRLGTFIVSKEPVILDKVTESIHQNGPTDIAFLPVGFNQAKLEQIVNLLINAG